MHDFEQIAATAVDRPAAVHTKQVLNYLRLRDLRVGLLMNFGQEVLRDALWRVANGPTTFVPSRFRANAQSQNAENQR